MNVPLLDLKAQYQAMKDEITHALEGVLQLEEKIAAYCGSTYGIGISSGSDALLLCLMAEKIGPGER